MVLLFTPASHYSPVVFVALGVGASVVAESDPSEETTKQKPTQVMGTDTERFKDVQT